MVRWVGVEVRLGNDATTTAASAVAVSFFVERGVPESAARRLRDGTSCARSRGRAALAEQFLEAATIYQLLEAGGEGYEWES